MGRTYRQLARPSMLCSTLLGMVLSLGLLQMAHAGEYRIEVRDQDRNVVQHAVITLYWEGKAPISPEKREMPAAEMDQRNEQFVPHVLPVRTGTLVRFPNSDNVRHHVYSFSRPKPFELKLYSGVPQSAIEFDKPGEVVLGCNIHDHMLGYIYVVDTPFFAVTDSLGKAEIRELPEGPYRLELWHPRQRDASEPLRIEASAGEPHRLSLDIHLTGPPPLAELATPASKD